MEKVCRQNWSIQPHRNECLAWLAEGLCRSLQSSLGEIVNGQWSLRLLGGSLVRVDDFLQSVEEPTCCYRLTAGNGSPSGGSGSILIEITPTIAFPIINCLLGGSSDDAFIPRRPLTAIERRLLQRVVETITAGLLQSLPGGASRNFEGPPPGADPAPVRPSPEGSVAPGTPPAGDADHGAAACPMVALSAGIEALLDAQAGTIRLCISQDLLGPLASPLRDEPTCDSPLEVSASLPEVMLAPGDVEQLAQGDILTSDTLADGEVIIRVAGIPKYVGRLAACNGNRAVTIIRKL